MKKTLSLLLALLLCLGFIAACGDKAPAYRTDIAPADLAAAAEPSLTGASSMTDPGSDYIAGMMQADLSLFDGQIMKIQTIGTAIDEYGIFKAADPEKLPEIEALIKAYLEGKLAAWIPDCMPEEEYPKLQAASYKIFGSYIVYGILADTEKEAFFAAIEAALLEK